MPEEYRALTVTEKVIEILRNCFESECRGDGSARNRAESEIQPFLVETGDGSFTLRSSTSNGSSETMHTKHGAVEEAIKKFVEPSKLLDKGDVNVLDICSGLGYNAAACLEVLRQHPNKKGDSRRRIHIDMVEISKETLGASLLISSPIKSHEIIKTAVERELIHQNLLKFKFQSLEIPGNVSIKIHCQDARKVVMRFLKEVESGNGSIPVNNQSHFGCEENKCSGDNSHGIYDAVFLDPFSPMKSPEIYSVEFFKALKVLMKGDGVILTYTSAAPVRTALLEAGFHVGEGPNFGGKNGTIASPSIESIDKDLSSLDERMIALTDTGVPFRDPSLKDSGSEISEKRGKERKYVRSRYKFASTVRAPTYLCRELEDSRLKRRVLKNLHDLGFEGLNSSKSRFIVCPQFDRCICGRNCRRFDNSRDRIFEMAKRLSKVLKDDTHEL